MKSKIEIDLAKEYAGVVRHLNGSGGREKYPDAFERERKKLFLSIDTFLSCENGKTVKRNKTYSNEIFFPPNPHLISRKFFWIFFWKIVQILEKTFYLSKQAHNVLVQTAKFLTRTKQRKDNSTWHITESQWLIDRLAG